MKTQLLATLLVLSLAATLRAAADSCDDSTVCNNAVTAPAATKSIKAVLKTPRIDVGDSRMNVVKRLGSPSFCASPEVWVYDGFHVENPAPGQEKLTHLIVRFEGRRVVRTELAAPEYVAELRQPAIDSHQALVLK